jgi:hypothetical protein
VFDRAAPALMALRAAYADNATAQYIEHALCDLARRAGLGEQDAHAV